MIDFLCSPVPHFIEISPSFSLSQPTSFSVQMSFVCCRCCCWIMGVVYSWTNPSPIKSKLRIYTRWESWQSVWILGTAYVSLQSPGINRLASGKSGRIEHESMIEQKSHGQGEVVRNFPFWFQQKSKLNTAAKNKISACLDWKCGMAYLNSFIEDNLTRGHTHTYVM